MGTALITGASAGLGLEFAKLFAGDGHSVILAARRRARLEDLAGELRRVYTGVRVDVLEIDLARPGAGAELFAAVRNLDRSVDFLVNNAGVGTNGAFAELPLAGELQEMDLNMRALVELTHLFLPEMLARRRGHVLNVGSMAGFQPGPFMATYYATKAFVNSFSEALHDELAGTGVSCTVLAPGATKTEFAQSSGTENTGLFQSTSVAAASEVAAFGYQAMKRGQSIAVPGFMNQASVQSQRFAPRFLVRKIAAGLNRRKPV